MNSSPMKFPQFLQIHHIDMLNVRFLSWNLGSKHLYIHCKLCEGCTITINFFFLHFSKYFI
ncbi:unnamed protein product [Moneuplotes crassus]|uniref:Uncharacterized protein n=1 Tax=Euplotes crassus TaxID=5936 RepID=A0AAD1Y6J3_EUPCR|nr:unnamed protein product [Moneuplotes crassus]